MHSSSSHVCYMPFPSHPPWLDHSNYTWERNSSLCGFLQPHIISCLWGQNILLSILFSNTLSLCSSFNVRDQVSHPNKITGKIIVLDKRWDLFWNSAPDFYPWRRAFQGPQFPFSVFRYFFLNFIGSLRKFFLPITLPSENNHFRGHDSLHCSPILFVYFGEPVASTLFL
jgi:hypothetical protein